MKKQSLNRMLSILLCLCLTVALLPISVSASPDPLWSTDTEAVAPVGNTYTITNARELAWVAKQVNDRANDFSGKTVVLANDIDLAGKEWVPIGEHNTSGGFEGTFDGQGNVIKNMNINSVTGNGSSAGLFSYIVSATIKNVGIVSGAINVTDATYAGGVVGRFNYSTVRNCYNLISVINSGITSQAGGIAGYAGSSSIENCYNTGAVTAQYAGGVLGYNVNVTINNCYFLSSAATKAVGGGSGTLTSLGSFPDSGGALTATDSTTLSNGDNLLGALNAGKADGDIPWKTGANGYPVFDLKWSDSVTAVTPVGNTYTITTAQELAWVAKQVHDGSNDFSGKTIILANDIDLAGKEWVPIGINISSSYFCGVFDGNGYVIKNMNITSVTGSYYCAGLFGAVRNGTIKNIGIVSGAINVTDAGYAGGVAGYPNDSTVRNCYNLIQVTNTHNSGITRAGGISGCLQKTTMENCYNTGTVSALTKGGIVGETSATAVVTNCYFLSTAASNAIGSGNGTLTSLGSFQNSGGALTATDNTSLENGNNLLAALNAGNTDTNYKWAADSNIGGYPKLVSLSSEDKLREAAAAGGEYALDCDIDGVDKLISQLDVLEDFTLDLNGYTLEIEVDDNNGIKIASGKTFTIEDGSNPSKGTLTVRNTCNKSTFSGKYAGIYTTDGKLVIESGTVNASGGEVGAAIGGGISEDGGTIEIRGGTINAIGHSSAAIGGGYIGSGGEITISGGTVNASGGSDSAAIGGSFMGASGTITISGGTVNAIGHNSGLESPAIGGGYEGRGGIITISGGIVNAKGSGGEQDIGWNGRSSSAGTTTITGGSVFAANGKINGFGETTLYPVKVTVKQGGSNVDGASVTHSNYTGNVTTGGNYANSDFTDLNSGVAWLWLPADEANISASKSGLSASTKYEVTESTSANAVTITLLGAQSALSITGKPATVTYGDTFTLGTSGGSGSGAVTYAVTSGGSYATVNSSTGAVTTKGVGSVTITATKAADETYSAATATTTFTVAAKQLTWSTTGTVSSKTYDGTTAATVSTAPTLVGIINNDTVTITVGTVKLSSANVGTRGVTASNYAISGADVGKYIAPTSQPTFANASISKATLTITPDSGQKKYYGQSDPTLTYTYSGNIEGETPTFDYALSRAAGETVGNYAISLGTLTLMDNGTFLASNYTLALSATAVNFAIVAYEPSEVATLSPNGDNGWFKSGNVTLTAPTGYTISASNALTGNTWASSITLNNDDGASKSATYYLKNSATGAISTAKTISYKVDKTAPTTPEITIEETNTGNFARFMNFITFGAFFKEGFKVTVTSTDALSGVDSITYNKGDGDVLTDTTTDIITFYVTHDFKGTISAFATDKAGNNSLTATSVGVVNESTAPTITVNNEDDFTPWLKANKDMSVTVDDADSGINKIEYSINGGSAVAEFTAAAGVEITTTKSFTIPVTIEGSYDVVINVEDNSGNISTKTVAVNLDKTVPIISGITDGSAYCAEQTVTVTDENLDTVTVNGTEVTLTDGKFTLSPAIGTQAVVATDEAGNSTTITVTINDGHTWGSWTQTTAPTCTEKGLEKRVCSVCEEEETQDVAALGHDWETEFTTDTAATCTAVGSKSHHCSICDEKTDVTEIPATGHTYGEWSVTKKATTKAEGERKKVCSVCGDVVTEKIDKLKANDSTVKSPDTGDNTPTIPLMLGLLLSGTLIIPYSRRKKFKLRKTAK